MSRQNPLDPHLRIGDAEREAAVTALGEHFAAGRLDHAEFDERSARAYAARTAAELQPLFTDLPAPHPLAPTVSARSAPGSTVPAGARDRAPRRPRLPLVPVLMIALAVMVFTGAAWPVLLLAFGLWWMTRSFGTSRARGGWPCGMRSPHGQYR